MLGGGRIHRLVHGRMDVHQVTVCVLCVAMHVLQEARLKHWQSPQRPSSTLDDFAAASGYGSFAADAMARVRARLAGYEDDDSLQQQQHPGASEGQQGGGAAADAPQQQQQQGRQRLAGLAACSLGVRLGAAWWLFACLWRACHNRGCAWRCAWRLDVLLALPCSPSGVSPAATRVLDELLLGCCCREERATLLPEACMPPGLEVRLVGFFRGVCVAQCQRWGAKCAKPTTLCVLGCCAGVGNRQQQPVKGGHCQGADQPCAAAGSSGRQGGGGCWRGRGAAVGGGPAAGPAGAAGGHCRV